LRAISAQFVSKRKAKLALRAAWIADEITISNSKTERLAQEIFSFKKACGLTASLIVSVQA
jgi:hypothetical protein